MFRCILVLLLVSSSYRSLGNPINPTARLSVANSLTALAEVCKNEFLSNQIKSRILDCTDLSSPHGEKQLQCLIFYDMSKQLCEALDSAKITLPQEDQASKINEEQDASTLCTTAKDWVFSNLTDFSRYKLAVDKVFQHPVTCGKICSVEDLMSDDANIYCKYYKWGSDVLKQVPATSTLQNAQAAPEATHVENKDTSSPNSDLQDVQIKDTGSTKANSSASNSPLKVEAPANQETSSVSANQKSSVDPGIVSNVAAMPDIEGNADTSVDKVEDTGAMPENNIVEEEPNKSPEDTPVQTVAVTKSKTEEVQSNIEPAQKAEDKEIQLLNNELESKQPALDTQKDKPQNEVDDYQGIDSEEGKNGLSDMQGGDDGDDPNVGDLADDVKPPKKADTMSSSYLAEKVAENVYTNPIQDAFPEDDDHFFPFFLTAIILVVLLYVLYHNKNKVSKVFFGLLVEGRAGSRRRNSRGHAYRRLDTLEQAMSNSSAAPPSKIIY